MRRSRFRILNLDPDHYSPKARMILEEIADLDDGPVDRHRLRDIIGDYDAIVLRFSHLIDDDLLSRATSLKVIGTNTTGLDHIDIDQTLQRGIEVVSLRGHDTFLRGIHSTAELTWGLLIALVRNLSGAAASVTDGDWDRDRFVGHELAERSIGVLGAGRIGEKIVGYARAFLMDVHGYDIDLAARERVAGVIWHDTLESLLQDTDVLSIHIPLNTATEGLIGRSQLACLRQGALIVNTSRGAIINEMAMVDALRQGKLAGYAADVLCGEGTEGFPRCSPVWRHAQEGGNVLLTPHIGGATHEAWESTETFVARNLVKTLTRWSQ